ncbi:phospholipid hydroperoxide glutathione peroxidase [Pyrus ussuriensis x Pyrus communis]|uniref:Glutathione peroxidase n=1 Tax=Pyrus ussuriensis x Pyrus communis TaxID=2448454 RepID=A0A5N5HC26_9ROSA|nr:phospholipid hydroperoxide glutathione peroxidase [Pyrus ussuriensis x Pyrus communis]
MRIFILRLGEDPGPSLRRWRRRGETGKFDSVKDIHGNDVNLSEYSGKVLLIVNVASKCGLTQSNYKELSVLYEKYKSKGFEILAFPCNQFGGQEPGNNEEIQEVACTRFKAEFPIFDKIEVNGKNEAPLYKFLKGQKGGVFGSGIKWNFTKFLINKEGKVVERYAPVTSPLKIEVRVIFVMICLFALGIMKTTAADLFIFALCRKTSRICWNLLEYQGLTAGSVWSDLTENKTCLQKQMKKMIEA